jgi:hypothetical protein
LCLTGKAENENHIRKRLQGGKDVRSSDSHDKVLEHVSSRIYDRVRREKEKDMAPAERRMHEEKRKSEPYNLSGDNMSDALTCVAVRLVRLLCCGRHRVWV